MSRPGDALARRPRAFGLYALGQFARFHDLPILANRNKKTQIKVSEINITSIDFHATGYHVGSVADLTGTSHISPDRPINCAARFIDKLFESAHSTHFSADRRSAQLRKLDPTSPDSLISATNTGTRTQRKSLSSSRMGSSRIARSRLLADGVRFEFHADSEGKKVHAAHVEHHFPSELHIEQVIFVNALSH
jgi:hypothetical protein